MKKYIKPELNSEIIVIEDIMTTSTGGIFGKDKAPGDIDLDIFQIMKLLKYLTLLSTFLLLSCGPNSSSETTSSTTAISSNTTIEETSSPSVDDTSIVTTEDSTNTTTNGGSVEFPYVQ